MSVSESELRSPPSRFRFGLRGQLFVLSIAVIAIGVLGAQLYMSQALDAELHARVHDQLAIEAAVAAVAVENSGAYDPPHARALTARLGRASRARVTLIDPSGLVVADSAVPEAQLAGLENHANRPEVREAMRTGSGSAERESGTLREPLVYLARRVEGPGGAWVVRVATASQLLESARGAMRRLLVVAAMLGLFAAALMSSLAVSLLTRPVRLLTRTAHEMVSDLRVRARVRPAGEVGALARALDELADARAASLAGLAEERDRLESVLEGMAEGVLVTGSDGAIVRANRAIRAMFYVGRDVVGQSPVEAFRQAELYETLKEAMRSAEPVSREIAIEGVRPRRMLVRAARLGHPGGGAVAVLTDLTELRRLETVRRDFVANVSHELRTPIAAIRAALETLESGAAARPETAHEFIGIVSRHAERLQSIVEDLLQLSRIEANELALEPRSLPARSALVDIVDRFRLAARARRVNLEVSIPDATLALRVDPRALESMVGNLVDNAIKYAREGGSVWVSAARADDGRVRVTVADDGPGIEAKHVSRIFERFYRVDAGRSRQVGGTGLGLAIVKHLAEASGGSVSVESTVGRGSKFHLLLARGEDSTAASPQSA